MVQTGGVTKATRPFRQAVDSGIVDRAAALAARRGFARTSVQEVADAVGLSKAGLLHHFPSKDALREAVLAQARDLVEQVLDRVRHLPAGADRDRLAVEVLVDVALAHPGLVSLLLSPATQGDLGDPDVEAVGAAALQAFGIDPESPVDHGSPVDPGSVDPQRLVRVTAACSALAVLVLAAHRRDSVTAWRPLIVAACFDALGHRRSAHSPDPEA